MKDWQNLIDSGMLDLYVLNQTSESENLLIWQMMETYPQVREEIRAIGLALEKYALEYAVVPNPVIKPFLMATIDFSERMKSGEQPVMAPLLHENSVPGDYQHWLARADMIHSQDAEDLFAKILSYTPEAITAMVWIRNIAPQEVHDHEYERFLILEGTCDIYVENDVFHLKPNDYFQIPLHKNHRVQVTSEQVCKVILQRVAVAQL